MGFSALILLTGLWLLTVLLIVSFLAGAKRLRGDEELVEGPLADATAHQKPVSQSLARHAGDRS